MQRFQNLKPHTNIRGRGSQHRIQCLQNFFKASTQGGGRTNVTETGLSRLVPGTGQCVRSTGTRNSLVPVSGTSKKEIEHVLFYNQFQVRKSSADWMSALFT